MKGKNVTTLFLLVTEKGGPVRHIKSVRYIPDKEQICLTEDETRHVYKMVETDRVINVQTRKQDIEYDKMTRNRLNKETTTETNPYQMVILNKVYIIKYIGRNLDMAPSLTVKPLDYRQHKRLYHSLKTDKGVRVDIEFEGDKLKEEYFDRHAGIYAATSEATRFDESTDLSTTYLGRIDMTRAMIFKVEEKFPIYGQGYTSGKLLDNTECSILLDTGVPLPQLPVTQSTI